MMKKNLTLLASSIFAIASINAQVLSEDFEGGAIPEGWTVSTNDAAEGGFAVGTNGASTSAAIPENGGNYAYVNDDACNCDMSEEILETPSTSIPAEGVHVLRFDYWFVNGDYQGADEVGTVQISSDAGASWDEVMNFEGNTEWQSAAIALVDYVGADIIVRFQYDDGGGWNYAYALDNVSIEELPAVAAMNAGTSVPEIYTTENGGLPIIAMLENTGGDAITTLTFNYSVNDGDTISAVMTDLNVASLGSEVLTHPTAYLPMELGQKTVKTWFSNLNETEETTGDTEGEVQMVDQHVNGFAFSETFTSNTCPPCAAFNPTYSGALNGYSATTAGSNVVAIKYQTDWPAPGTDACYNPDAQTRISAYGVNGVPSTYVQGLSPEVPLQTWAQYAAGVGETLGEIAMEDAFLGMTVSSVRLGNNVSVSVTLTPKANFPSGNILHVAIVNNEYTSAEISPNPTNGETEFDRVTRKMLPNGNGTTLGALEIDQVETFNFDYDVTTGGPTQSNYNLVNDDISVVAFVQNPTTNVVRMAKTADVVLSISENQIAEAITVGPNPANDVLNLRMNFEGQEEVSYTILNAVGQHVVSEALGTIRSADIHQIDVRNLDAGMYYLNISVDGVTHAEKFQVIK